MKLAIFGATGATGRLLMEQALARGHAVRAVARRPETISLRHERLQLVAADVTDQASVDAAVANQDAVLSAIGAPMSRQPTDVHARSALALLAAMHQHAVKRLMCITSGGTNPEHDPHLPWLFQYGFRRLFMNIYRDQMHMEALIMPTSLDWTIMRPAGLTHDAPRGSYRTAPGYALPGGRTIGRADLAACMLDVLERDAYVRQAVAIAY